MKKKGYCDWSVYFNYLQGRYPSIVNAVPYKTLAWPGNFTDWHLDVVPENFLFENFYAENYEEGAIFAGIASLYTDNVADDNQRKIQRYKANLKKYTDDAFFEEIFSTIYAKENGEAVGIGLYISEKRTELLLPKKLMIRKNGYVFIPFEIRNETGKIAELQIEQCIRDSCSKKASEAETIHYQTRNGFFRYPVYGTAKKGNYMFELTVHFDDVMIQKTIPINVV